LTLIAAFGYKWFVKNLPQKIFFTWEKRTSVVSLYYNHTR